MMSAFLFVTDLDNTLIGDDLALRELNQQLGQHREELGTKIVYATGRSLTLYQQLAQEKQLLTPDALITSVGTEIYFNSQENTFDPDWANLLAEDWDRDQVVAIASHYSDLELQPLSEQNPFKISYFLSEQVASTVIACLKDELSQNNLNVKIIYSSGQYLDLLPKTGDKGLAVNYLREKWQFSPLRTVLCGDSGNDIALFSLGEERAIIVGNATQELRQWYDFNQTDYRYLAKNFYGAGIMEGLKYLGFL